MPHASQLQRLQTAHDYETRQLRSTCEGLDFAVHEVQEALKPVQVALRCHTAAPWAGGDAKAAKGRTHAGSAVASGHTD